MAFLIWKREVHYAAGYVLITVADIQQMHGGRCRKSLYNIVLIRQEEHCYSCLLPALYVI